MNDEEIKMWEKYRFARENAKQRRAGMRRLKNRISLVTLAIVIVMILIQKLTQ